MTSLFGVAPNKKTENESCDPDPKPCVAIVGSFIISAYCPSLFPRVRVYRGGLPSFAPFMESLLGGGLCSAYANGETHTKS
jgi:hypothetical protein